jgi:hypothetical protein
VEGSCELDNELFEVLPIVIAVAVATINDDDDTIRYFFRHFGIVS